MWDHYLTLSKSGSNSDEIVGVKVEGQWYTVGKVAFDEDAAGVTEEYAVTRCKKLIAEHARRIYPVELPKNYDCSEVGVADSKEDELKDEDWRVVKSTADIEVSKEKDKAIGFEGIPDLPTGFYVCYDKGKAVETGFNTLNRTQKQSLQASNR